MISPQDIRKKAENLYGEYLRSWVRGEDSFFPRPVPVSRVPNTDVAVAAQEVQTLRAGSKQVVGYGYSIDWEEINSRRFGRNQFPRRIFFETREDLLRVIGKQREFDSLAATVQFLRGQLPDLEPWIISNLRVLVSLEKEIPGLVAVAMFFRNTPRPDRFVRELPLPVDTKFIERNKGVLRQWLDRLLPPDSILADEEHFERRFGLRYAEPDFFLRFLDSTLQAKLGFPCTSLSLPLSALSSLYVTKAGVIIVENRINLLTLPGVKGCIGLGGLGRAVTLLRYVPWLARCQIRYWGDIDVDGFEILSCVRTLFPQTTSVLMDKAVLESHRGLSVAGNGRTVAAPANLTEAERAAFDVCVTENLRIEQERLPSPDLWIAGENIAVIQTHSPNETVSLH